jgi:cobalt/nickel transport system permease protein
MHIPDGFLDAPTAAVAGALSVGAVAVAVRQTRLRLPPRKVPLMGLSAAFVFAAQMINFPVAGGTSGHLVGGVLCGVLLGPSAAVLVLCSVLVVQCFVFADGGVLSLGANIFNMGVVCPVVGYYVYRAVHRLLPDERGQLTAVAFASWVAIVAAAVSCAGQLALSKTVPWSAAFPVMTTVHMLIGLGEAALTTLVVFGITRSRPDLLLTEPDAPGDARGYGEIIPYGLLCAFGLAVFVSPFACPWPDGLEKVAAVLGFAHRAAAAGQVVRAPVPDYLFPGVSSAGVATAIAGAIGTVVAFVLATLFARLLVPPPPPAAEAA